MKNLRSGFSLVELMVVVAIIGILATIAVPNFTKFQAKAKQANAKSELTGLFTAEKAFYTEYNTYHSNLPYIGYVPDGLLSATATNCPSGVAPGVTRYYRVGFSSGADTEVNGTPITCTGGGAIANVNYYPEAGTSRAVVDSGLTGSVSSSTSFTAKASGMISNSTRDDMWTINENKSLVNTQQGL